MPINRKLIAKSNYVLRQIFQKKENILLLKDFIESIIHIKIEEIKIMPYLEKMSRYLPEKDNFGIVDVRVKTLDNENLNIGIQTIDGHYVQNKLLIYYAQIHANQLEHEGIYEEAKTITINIMDFNCIKENKKFHNLIKLIARDCEFMMHTIELSKFRKNVKEIENKEQAWVAYIANDNWLSNIATEKYKEIKQFDEVLEKYLNSEKME